MTSGDQLISTKLGTGSLHFNVSVCGERRKEGESEMDIRTNKFMFITNIMFIITEKR